MNGKLIKLLIIGFSDPAYSRPTGLVFETLINPDGYSEQFQIEYSAKQPLGSSGAQLKYKITPPGTIGFNVLFDSTGVIPTTSLSSAAAKTLPVPAQIELFKRVALNFKGDIHSPPFLRIVWGSLLFKGRLTKLDITYSLFSPNGIPLRAKAAVEFQGSMEPLLRALIERTSSPDLTHVRIVKAGDTLPALANEIYGDPARYLELARVNKLTNFRRLEPGTRLVFPPIER